MKGTILITGGGGYIASVAVSQFLREGWSVAAVDNFSRGFKKPLEKLLEQYGPNALRVYSADLREEIDSVFTAEKDIAGVIHYAAFCSVDESMHEPGLYFLNNTLGTNTLLEAMLKHSVKNLIFSSTCAVYGEAQTDVITEDHPTRPTNPYGESKNMAEGIIDWYARSKGLRYVILRYFNVCGATDDGLFGDAKKPSVHLVQNAVRGALGIEPFFLTCPQVDTPDGTPIRDYVNVVDLYQAHSNALEYLLTGGNSEIINIGTGEGYSVKQIIAEVQNVTGVHIPLHQDSKIRQGEYAKMVASHAKATEVLNWKPSRSLSESINSLMKWYSLHPHGWTR